MKEFVTNTIRYLEHHYSKENSEPGFVAEEKMIEWSIAQRREDGKGGLQLYAGFWHKLFDIATP